MKSATYEPLEELQEASNQVDSREGESTSNGATPRMDGHPLFARSPVMREFMEQATQASRTSQLICLTGEPGTGRRVIARELHTIAGGSEDRFMRLNAAGLDRATLEARLTELSPAAGVRTIYVPHLAEMPFEAQEQLARFLREQTSSRSPLADTGTRITTSLDTSLLAAVEDGKVLSELADQTTSLDVPALRQRKLDIPLLGEQLLQEAAVARGTAPRVFSRAAASLLSALPWPRNTPELKAFVTRIATGVDRPVVELDDLLANLTLATSDDRGDAGMTLRKAREQFERDCISAALVKHRGRMADAAQALGIQRTNLYRKIRQLKVPRAGRPTGR